MMNLQAKYETYLKLLPTVQDTHGFIESDHCDSLLFSGLLGCVPEVDVRIDAALDPDTGMWHRRPIENPCFDCKTGVSLGSKSTISRDMLVGLAWYAWHNKRLDISEQVINHAMRNWGFMGCAQDLVTKWGRCQIMPPLFATFCWISYRLGGPNRWWARCVPADMGGNVEGFESHLQMLHILLRKDLGGWITPCQRRTIKRNYKRSPENPLFAYMAGDLEGVIKTLEREDLWPSDRLPTKGDRKTEWIPMREQDDWVPSDRGADRKYSGGDFLFLHWLVTR